MRAAVISAAVALLVVAAYAMSPFTLRVQRGNPGVILSACMTVSSNAATGYYSERCVEYWAAQAKESGNE